MNLDRHYGNEFRIHIWTFKGLDLSLLLAKFSLLYETGSPLSAFRQQ